MLSRLRFFLQRNFCRVLRKDFGCARRKKNATRVGWTLWGFVFVIVYPPKGGLPVFLFKAIASYHNDTTLRKSQAWYFLFFISRMLTRILSKVILSHRSKGERSNTTLLLLKKKFGKGFPMTQNTVHTYRRTSLTTRMIIFLMEKQNMNPLCFQMETRECFRHCSNLFANRRAGKYILLSPHSTFRTDESKRRMPRTEKVAGRLLAR